MSLTPLYRDAPDANCRSTLVSFVLSLPISQDTQYPSPLHVTIVFLTPVTFLVITHSWKRSYEITIGDGKGGSREGYQLEAA